MITESHGRSHTGSTNDSYTRRPPLTSKSRISLFDNVDGRWCFNWQQRYRDGAAAAQGTVGTNPGPEHLKEDLR
jgi:hypothetical protein